MDYEGAPRLESQLQLTLRILEHFRVAGEERPTLLPGRLPEGLNFDLPLPEGAALVGSEVSESSANIFVDTAMTPDEAIAFYQRAFERLGWEAQPAATHEPEGAVWDRFGESEHDERPEDLVSPDGQLTLSITASEMPAGLTSLMLHVGSREERAPDPEEEAAMHMVELLPELHPPPDAEQWEVGFSGDPHSAQRRLDVATGLDIAALAAHYNREIVGAGWRRTDQEITARAGWSAWVRGDESGEQLYLVWFAFRVPSTPPMYTVVVQVGRQQVTEPLWSWYFSR